MTLLSNTEIRTKSLRDNLINPFNPKNLGGASYELTCSSIYYDLTEGTTLIDSKSHKGTIIIKPKHTVAIITKESLSIPYNLAAHIISKGSLFSIGLAPVSTYADPGFIGQLGLVTTNNSDKYIVLAEDEAIAKIHFTELTSDATINYKGQHGFQSKLWPIRTDLQKNHTAVKHDKRVRSEEEEAMAILPTHTSIALKEIARQNNTILIVIAVAFSLNALLFFAIANSYSIDTILSIATSLIASGVVALIARANSKSMKILNSFKK